MRTEVPDRLTPLTIDEAIEAFAEAHRLVMGSEPTAGALAAIVGHSALETGHWKFSHVFNLGNEKAPADWDDLVTTFDCDETFDGPTAMQAQRLGRCKLTARSDGKVHVWLYAGHPWAYFKAFADAAHGAKRHLELVTLNPRYRTAWHSACQGDAQGYALELCAAGYATAPDRVGYAHSVASIAARILPSCASYLSGDGHALTSDDRAYIEALIYRTLDENRSTDPSELAPESVA
jgi:hypothetical protein